MADDGGDFGAPPPQHSTAAALRAGRVCTGGSGGRRPGASAMAADVPGSQLAGTLAGQSGSHLVRARTDRRGPCVGSHDRQESCTRHSPFWGPGSDLCGRHPTRCGMAVPLPVKVLEAGHRGRARRRRVRSAPSCHSTVRTQGIGRPAGPCPDPGYARRKDRRHCRRRLPCEATGSTSTPKRPRASCLLLAPRNRAISV